MHLVVKPPKLRAVVLKNSFLLKFNMPAYTGSSICRGVVLSSMIIAKSIISSRCTFFTPEYPKPLLLENYVLIVARKLDEGFPSIYSGVVKFIERRLVKPILEILGL
jgi:hypothetical protein